MPIVANTCGFNHVPEDAPVIMATFSSDILVATRSIVHAILNSLLATVDCRLDGGVVSWLKVDSTEEAERL